MNNVMSLLGKVRTAVRSSFVMTHQEYRANLAGLNIFFGAVLGVVMAGTQTLDARDFAIVLFFTAGVVVSILYISASRHRLLYSVLVALFVWMMPLILGTAVTGGALLPDKLQPTLAVWAVIVVAIEFAPREKAPAGGDAGE